MTIQIPVYFIHSSYCNSLASLASAYIMSTVPPLFCVFRPYLSPLFSILLPSRIRQTFQISTTLGKSRFLYYTYIRILWRISRVSICCPGGGKIVYGVYICFSFCVLATGLWRLLYTYF